MAARTIAFVLGAAACHLLPELPDPLYSGLFPLLAPALLAPRRVAVLAAFAIGIALTAAHAHAGLAARLPAALQGRDLDVRGTITGVPEGDDERVRLRMRLDRVDGDAALRWRWTGCLIALTWYEPPASPAMLPRAGQRWRATVRLRQPRGLHNAGGFDAEHRALRDGVCAVGYMREGPAPRRLSAVTPGIDTLRAALASRLDLKLADLPARGIAKALVVGLRGDVTAAQEWLLQSTGTAHLMAISGLHVGLVAGLGLLLGRLAPRAIPGALRVAPAAYWGAATALLAAAAYAALAGFSVPTQRALVMLAVVLLGSFARRRPARVSALLTALAVVVVIDPMAVRDTGTWLSFAAVAGLMWALPGTTTKKGSKLARVLWQAGRTQVVACLIVLPLALACFGHQPVSAPLANLIAIPATGLMAVPALLAGVVLDAAGLDPDGTLLRLGTHVMGVLLEILARLPGQGRQLVAGGPVSALALGAAFVGIAVATLPLAWRTRVVGLLWLAPLLVPPSGAPPSGGLTLRVLDVGQGLAVVLRTRSHVLVYDTGPAWGRGRDAGARVVAPALRRDGAGHVDRLMVSHHHADHSGGVAGLHATLPVREVLGDDGRGLSSRPCIRGEHWIWDGYRFEILHPAHDGVRGNDASCVLHVSGPGGSVLLPGDIEAQTESLLVRESGERLSANVLLVPHHGSRTSSSEAFVRAVGPGLAVIASGHRNRFRLPAPDVVARYRALGIRLEDTACAGEVVVHLAPGVAPVVQRWRDRASRFWHSRDLGPHCLSGPAPRHARERAAHLLESRPFHTRTSALAGNGDGRGMAHGAHPPVLRGRDGHRRGAVLDASVTSRDAP